MTIIRTCYVGPRGLTGARIVAREIGTHRQRTVPYPHHLRQGEQAHASAAAVLCERLGIDGSLSTEATDNPAVYFHTVSA